MTVIERQKNLTRRRGGAEDVREVLKISLRSLRSFGLKFFGGRRRPRTIRSELFFCDRDFWRLPHFLDGKPSSRRPRQAPSRERFRLTQYGISHFEQSVTALPLVAPLPPFISSRTSSAPPRLRVSFFRAALCTPPRRPRQTPNCGRVFLTFP